MITGKKQSYLELVYSQPSRDNRFSIAKKFRIHWKTCFRSLITCLLSYISKSFNIKFSTQCYLPAQSCLRYCKIPKIGPVFFFFEGLIYGGACNFGGACSVYKVGNLHNQIDQVSLYLPDKQSKSKVVCYHSIHFLLCFILYLRAISKACILRGNLIGSLGGLHLEGNVYGRNMNIISTHWQENSFTLNTLHDKFILPVKQWVKGWYYVKQKSSKFMSQN